MAVVLEGNSKLVLKDNLYLIEVEDRNGGCVVNELGNSSHQNQFEVPPSNQTELPLNDTFHLNTNCRTNLENCNFPPECSFPDSNCGVSSANNEQCQNKYANLDASSGEEPRDCLQFVCMTSDCDCFKTCTVETLRHKRSNSTSDLNKFDSKPLGNHECVITGLNVILGKQFMIKREEPLQYGKITSMRRPFLFYKFQDNSKFVTERGCNNSNDSNSKPTNSSNMSRYSVYRSISGKVIRVEGDGRCLFRSLVTCLSPDLQKARRNDFGCPLHREDYNYETLMSDALRAKVVKLMRDNSHFYKQLEGTLLNADRATPTGYSHFKERLRDMTLTSTMPGDLELNAISSALERQVLVLDVNLRPIVVYGRERYPQSRIITVRYTRLGPEVGHYDAVIPDLDVSEVLHLGPYQGDSKVNESDMEVETTDFNCFSDLLPKTQINYQGKAECLSPVIDHKSTQVPSQQRLCDVIDSGTTISSWKTPSIQKSITLNNTLGNKNYNKSHIVNTDSSSLSLLEDNSLESLFQAESTESLLDNLSDDVRFYVIDSAKVAEDSCSDSHVYTTVVGRRDEHGDSNSGKMNSEHARREKKEHRLLYRGKRIQNDKNGRKKRAKRCSSRKRNGNRRPAKRYKKSTKVYHRKRLGCNNNKSKPKSVRIRKLKQSRCQVGCSGKKNKTTKNTTAHREGKQNQQNPEKENRSGSQTYVPAGKNEEETCKPDSHDNTTSNHLDVDMEKQSKSRACGVNTCFICKKATAKNKSVCIMCGRAACKQCIGTNRRTDDGDNFVCSFCSRD